MKTRNHFFALTLLSLIACGANDPTVSTGQGETASSNTALVQSTMQLSSDRVNMLVADYAALDQNEFSESNQATAFASDQAFAQVDVSSPIKSASFGHSTMVLVPAGTASAPTDPNRSQQFYVAYGASTNTAAMTFGPFQVLAQEGMSCGGFTASPVQCAQGLVCVASLKNPDAPGSCEQPSTN